MTRKQGKMSAMALAAAFMASTSLSGQLFAAESPYRNFDIKSQSLVAAIQEFSDQADIQILYSHDVVKEFKTAGLRGRYGAEEGLKHLLRNLGLFVHHTDKNTYVINNELLNNSSLVRSISLTASADDREYYESNLSGYVEDEDQDRTEELEIEEIVITGTHIRGIGLSVGSKTEIIDRVAIDRSGFATAHQILQNIPQAFQGGANEDTRIGSAGTNITSASSINLRGLGTSSTLVLLNGRRLPVAGSSAGFTDISNIPVSAIERIEVLPDGASAIYGSDAVAGVVNIILRKDFDGAETGARFGTVTEGGLQEYQFSQTFGKSWNGGNGLISYEYYNREPLFNTERDFAADSDLRSLGGDNFSNNFSNPGNITGGLSSAPPFFFGGQFAIPEGQDGTALTPGDLIPVPGPDVNNPNEFNFGNSNLGRNIQQDQERHSVFATLRQEAAERLEFFAEGRFSQRDFDKRVIASTFTLSVPSTNAFFVDPYGGAETIFVNYDFFDDIGSARQVGSVKSYNGVFGTTYEFGRDWQLRGYGSYSKEDSKIRSANQIDFFGALPLALADSDPATAFNPFGDGLNTNPATLQGLLFPDDAFANDFESEVWSLNLVADGTLFELPGGGVKLAAGIDFRDESFASISKNPFLVGGILEDTGDREVFAAFGEVYIPLVGENNRRGGVEKLAVSAAVRYEDYNDSGSTTNPKVGLLWSPAEGLNIRGSYSTAFQAPRLLDRNTTANGAVIVPLPDPMGVFFGSTISLLQSGSGPDLENETSTNWTVGFDFAPPGVPGLKFDLTYFYIDFKDRLASVPNPLTIFFEEERFASRINRTPSQAQLDAICSSPEFFDTGQPCTVANIGAIVDIRLDNTARTKVSGLDGNFFYGFDLGNGGGRLDFRLNGSYLFKFEEQFSSIAPVFDIVDTINNPVDFKMRNNITWSHNSGFSATAFINYTDSYKDNLSDPERDIDSWTTVDLTLTYNTRDGLGNMGLNDTTFSISVLNVFNTDPPFANNPIGVGYDPENADPLGRFISFNLVKKW